MSARIFKAWTQHRRALEIGTASDGDVGIGAESARLIDQDFVAFLTGHGLGPWWMEHIESAKIEEQVAPAVAGSLAVQRRSAVAQYMLQCAAIHQLGVEFDRREIAYAVIKGGATREVAYIKPHLRVVCDVDILVRPSDQSSAAAALREIGYKEDATSTASTHEVTYVRGTLAIDLHWNVLSPGRTRRNATDELLLRRVREKTFWRLSDDDTVLLMLAHPAFAKYVCSPHMGLNRVLDLGLFIQKRGTDWNVVAIRLASLGLQSAAWCTLTWMQMVDRRAHRIPATFVAAIAPNALKRWYLRKWLERDLPGRLSDRADWVIQVAFTLPMHDSLQDAWKAIAYRVRSRAPRSAIELPT